MAKKDACIRVAHWALRLEEFEYTVEHRIRNVLRNVNAACRRNPTECLMVQKTMQDALAEQIKQM